MVTIRPSSDLRNKYNEISDFCNRYNEPVFITKNGTGENEKTLHIFRILYNRREWQYLL